MRLVDPCSSAIYHSLKYYLLQKHVLVQMIAPWSTFLTTAMKGALLLRMLHSSLYQFEHSQYPSQLMRKLTRSLTASVQGVDFVAALKSSLIDEAPSIKLLLTPEDAAELLQQAQSLLVDGLDSDTTDGLLPVVLAPHLLSTASSGASFPLKLAADLKLAATR